jgi:hypothetical protein
LSTIANNFKMVSLLLLFFSLPDLRPQCRQGFRATRAALPKPRAATSAIPSPHLPSIPVFHLASRRQLKQSEQAERGRLLPPPDSHGRPEARSSASSSPEFKFWPLYPNPAASPSCADELFDGGVLLLLLGEDGVGGQYGAPRLGRQRKGILHPLGGFGGGVG